MKIVDFCTCGNQTKQISALAYCGCGGRSARLQTNLTTFRTAWLCNFVYWPKHVLTQVVAWVQLRLGHCVQGAKAKTGRSFSLSTGSDCGLPEAIAPKPRVQGRWRLQRLPGMSVDRKGRRACNNGGCLLFGGGRHFISKSSLRIPV